MNQTLFTVGPVEMYPETLRLGGVQLPYFRTEEFSRSVLSCEAAMQALVGAPAGARTVFLTASGTGAMEAAMINLLGEDDRALVISGGSFGQRFCEICEDDQVPYDAVRLQPGKSPEPAAYAESVLRNYSALAVNAHETSTGLLYDLRSMGLACRKAGVLFIVDAISAFLCDEVNMEEMGIDVLITSSQKALALPPGLSIMVLSPRAVQVAAARKVRSHYFGLAKYLKDGARGQTPFTPAVGVILQLKERLGAVANKGAAASIARAADLAAGFRASIAGLPLSIFPDRASNALTALSPTTDIGAYEIYSRLRAERGLVVTPNGGELRDRVFRVGHMGNLESSDLSRLASALEEILR